MPTLRFRDGDKFITTTTTVEPAVIDYADIAAAVEIEQDDMSEAPWQNCDGYEHEAVRPDRLDDAADAEKMQGWTWDDGNRERVVITLPKGDPHGIYKWLRDQGASKQVAAEAVAADRRRTIEQLADWYRNGWEWWYVSCDFNGCHAGVGGVDDYDYADKDCRHEIAREVAHELEKKGYTVVNYPTPEPRLGGRMTRDAWLAQWKRNLASQNYNA